MSDQRTQRTIREGKFMKTIAFTAAVIVAGLTVSAAATPAFAKAEGRFGNARVTYQADSGRYCLRETRTGSLIPATACRSKGEWAQEGLTIRHKAVAPVQLAQR
jgi:hypothetical protein